MNHSESTVIVEPRANQQALASVIWLHGLGADGHDFEPIVPALQLPATLPIRFIFPHAPMRPVTLNNGYVMRAWFDITALKINGPIDEAGMQSAIATVEALITRESERGIPPERIVLAGFSQGGAVALQAGFTCKFQLAGVMGLSTFLLMPEAFKHAKIFRQQTPLFMAHGEQDMVVPYAWGQGSCEKLRELALTPEWHAYRMGHEVCPQEVRDISVWLQKVLLTC